MIDVTGKVRQRACARCRTASDDLGPYCMAGCACWCHKTTRRSA